MVNLPEMWNIHVSLTASDDLTILGTFPQQKFASGISFISFSAHANNMLATSTHFCQRFVLCSCSELFPFPVIPAGFPWLCVGLLNYHAGLHPEAAESLIAASGLHTQKPQCPLSATPAAGSAAAAVHA